MNIVDIVMIVTLIMTFLIMVSTVYLSRRKKTPLEDVDNQIAIAVKLRNTWLGSSIAFLIAYYWFVLMSILSTLIVLYLGCFENTSLFEIKARLILYSAMSLFTTICPYVVNFLKISRKYRLAFCTLEEQLLMKNDLGNAIIEGEKIIVSAFDE